MPKTNPAGDLTTDRPTLQPPTDEHAGRRSRVESALAAGQLTIRTKRSGMTHTVAVFGELDVATAQRVDDELEAVAATDTQQIVLDLTRLTFMDTSGVHLIAQAHARCSATAKQLALLRGPRCIRRVFELAAADALPSAA